MSYKHSFLTKMHYILFINFVIIPCAAMSNVVHHIKKVQKKAWSPGKLVGLETYD